MKACSQIGVQGTRLNVHGLIQCVHRLLASAYILDEYGVGYAKQPRAGLFEDGKSFTCFHGIEPHILQGIIGEVWISQAKREIGPNGSLVFSPCTQNTIERHDGFGIGRWNR